MKTVLIIQDELPAYRDFLWCGLRSYFNLYLADVGGDKLWHPDGSVSSFHDFDFATRLDCLVLNAGIREAGKAALYIIKFRPRRVLGWTQFVGKNKNAIYRIAKCFYLQIFYDKTLLYYEHEKRLIPFDWLRRRCVGLNNTVADGVFLESTNPDRRSILFIGRYTEKSRLALLLEAATAVKNINLHIIGVKADDVPAQFRDGNFHFHGKTDDQASIQKVAASCAFFVYPGDVGLSIVHAIKLGLIPVVHADLDSHMPECRAVAEKFPVIFFQKNDLEHLSKVLSMLIEFSPSMDLKRSIASQGRKIFSEEVMISNFVSAVEDC